MLNNQLTVGLCRWFQYKVAGIAARRRRTADYGAFIAAEVLECRRVLAATTNAVVGSSADPSVSGQAVTFTVAVAPAASSTLVPTGTVTFKFDGKAQPVVTLVNGLATMNSSTLSAGTHTITAVYNGDKNFITSTSPTFSQVVTATQTAPWHPTGALDVTSYGVIGDGVTDDTAALQNLINSIPANKYYSGNTPGGVLFYFPAGTYVVNNTVDFSRLSSFGILGDATSAGLPASTITTTTANIAAVNLNVNNGSHTFQIKNMGFSASINGGTGLFASNAENSSLENCCFSGYIGFNDQSPFEVAIRSSRFIGSAGSNIGLLTFGATGDLVESSDFSGWSEGIRAAGMGLSVSRSTFEHNGIGARLGADPQGNNWVLGRSALQDLSFTDNSTALSLQVVSFDVFSNISITGTSNAPSGQSQYGLYNHAVGSVTFSGIQVGGGFSNAAVYLYGGGDLTFYSSTVSNSITGAAVWNTQAGLTGVPADQITLLHNNNPLTNVSVLSSSLLKPVNVDDVTASHVVAGPQNMVLDVTKYGIIGDNKTDDTAALQALINSAAAGTTFYFPQGVYTVSATIDFSRLKSFSIVGDVAAIGGSGNGSTIRGSFAAPLIKVDYGSGAGTFHISNINLASSKNAGGVALYANNAMLSSIQNVQVLGNNGIFLEDPFKVTLRTVQFMGNHAGLVIHGGYGCTLESGDFMGCYEGVIAGATSAFAIFASRFEVNTIGMNLGVNPDGSASTLPGASVQGITEEANNYHIIVTSCSNSLFAGIGTQGSTNAPAGISTIGMQILNAQTSTFTGIGMGGAYSGPALQVLSAASSLYFSDCKVWNGLNNGTWDIRSINNIIRYACQ